MGRISDVLPHLYYDKKNDLIRFVDALDVEVKDFERKVKGISDLINVDKCPEDKLPYLAAITNCPLMGNNPKLWRRQIKNWPYLLKIKGTALSLELFLDSIDVDNHKIYTFFRDANGKLVEDKPEGQPFKDENGLWRNIRTHYFDLDIIWQDGHYLSWTEWHKDFLRSINIWLQRAKPFHSELRNLKLFLLRDSSQNLSIGTATVQGTHHDIGIVQGTSSSDDLNIYIGTGTFQTTHHDIAIVQGTHSSSDFDIAVGTGIVQGGHHDINMIQATSGNSELDVSIGTGTFHTWTYDVKHAQATEAETNSVIAVGANVIQGACHEVDIQQSNSGSAELGISVGTGTFQKISHEVNIQQATQSTAGSDIWTGAAVIQGSHHNIAMKQRTSGSTTLAIHAGIALLHRITHEVNIKQPVTAKTELNIQMGTGILQSSTHTISVGISTIARAEIFSGSALIQDILHAVGIKQGSGVADEILSVGCAVSCGIYMQIKMAA